MSTAPLTPVRLGRALTLPRVRVVLGALMPNQTKCPSKPYPPTATATDRRHLVTELAHQHSSRLRGIARQNGAGDLADLIGALTATDDAATITERRELHLERRRALDNLKPHERLALTLKGAGLSYAEVQAGTAWTYTKVNRLLTEARTRLRDLPSEDSASA